MSTAIGEPAAPRLVFTWLSTGAGGAEESLRILGEELAESDPAELVLWSEQPGAARCWPRERLHLAVDRQGYLAIMGAVLAARGGEERPTVLFSNHRTAQLDLQLARACGVPCVVVVRALLASHQAFRALGPAGDLQDRAGDDPRWASLGDADALVGVSAACCTHLQPLVRDCRPLCTIPNAVAGRWLGVDEVPLLRAPVRRLLLAGRLVAWKRSDVALDAFLDLAAAWPQLELAVAGDGPERLRLATRVAERRLERRVRFLGWQADMRRCYLAADALLCPSPSEAFCRVVAEAAACGLPAVVAAGGAACDWVVDGESGFVVPDGTPAAWRAALGRLLSMGGGERRDMGHYAARLARERFQPDDQVRAYRALAARLVNGRAGEGQSRDEGASAQSSRLASAGL